MNFNKYIIISSIAIALILNSCAHDHSDEKGHTHKHAMGTEAPSHDENETEHHEEHGIHLTPKQLKTMDIRFGDFSELKINDFVSATGMLGLPPNAYSSVSAKASGFIKNSKKYVEGSYVKKGNVLAFLENPDLIKIQREFLEISAELVFLNQELERQKKLNDANAGIEKNVQKLQSEVELKTVSVNALSKQLNYLGINVKKLTSNSIVKQIPIISPMSGFLTSINMHNGMFVEPSNELLEIVNDKHLHLELDVFEKDIGKIAVGQRLSYTVPALSKDVFQGEIHVIGKEFNNENKTVRIHGHPEGKQPIFIKDMFVDAKIWLNDQTAQALPEKAIITNGGSSFIFAGTENREESEFEFEKITVLPGATEDGFTSVKLVDEIPEGMRIVTKGAYFVYSQSVVGELEHSH